MKKTILLLMISLGVLLTGCQRTIKVELTSITPNGAIRKDTVDVNYRSLVSYDPGDPLTIKNFGPGWMITRRISKNDTVIGETDGLTSYRNGVVIK